MKVNYLKNLLLAEYLGRISVCLGGRFGVREQGKLKV